MEMPVTKKPRLNRSSLMDGVWGLHATKMDEVFVVPHRGVVTFFGTYKDAERFAIHTGSIVAQVKWVSPSTPRGMVYAMASATARVGYPDFVMSGQGGIA